MSKSMMSRSFNNIIPKEIDSEVKITKYLSMKTLAFVVVVIFVADQLGAIVHPKLKLVYFLFSLVLALAFIIPSAKNPEKQVFHTMLFTALKDNNVYHPMEAEEEDG